VLIAAALLGITVSSFAVAQTGDRDDAEISPARGEGDPIELGERNPRSKGSGRETAVVANVGKGGLVLRPSNTAKGGRAISATCDNDGQAAEDGCAVYVNRGKGAAASFRTQGSVPFALRDTNTGRVPYLNADMLDGEHATAFLRSGDRATDSARLEGKPASAFLGSTAKAADSEALDGKDSSAFLGSTAKAADSEALDGKDSSAFLGSTAKAADAEKLDGVESDDFTRVSGAVFADGTEASLGFDVTKTGTGVYQVLLDDGTFPNSGGSCSTLFPTVSSLGTDPVIAVVESAGCRTNGGGLFTVRTFNAAGGAVDSSFLFIADARP
jgi:hypothetical protein